MPEYKAHEAGFDIHLFDLHTFDFDGSFSAQLVAPGGLQVSTAFGVRFHVHYDYHGPIGGAGTCDFHIKDASASATAILGAANGRLELASSSQDAKLDQLDPNCPGRSVKSSSTCMSCLTADFDFLQASAGQC